METHFFKKVQRNRTHPLIFQPNITIWQELGNQHIMNESNISNINSILTMENSNNEDDEYTEFCENTIIKFKNLLRETQDLLDESINLPQRKKWWETSLLRMLKKFKLFKFFRLSRLKIINKSRESNKFIVRVKFSAAIDVSKVFHRLISDHYFLA
uniref:Uncharacterized protein n=1 Tax=Rhizophagus irregularis (strain DAOM 181602 / DAOM 197198 / MUCL 43194) TaxID=747089 RepID=U9V826_RHIID